MDPELLADAVGVVGLFDAFDHVAAATGFPLEAEKVQILVAYRAVLDAKCARSGAELDTKAIESLLHGSPSAIARK